MGPTKQPKSLEQAHRALLSLQEIYLSRLATTEAARKDEIIALNALNEAQKAFDDAVAETRKAAAPRGSDWATNKPEWTGSAI